MCKIANYKSYVENSWMSFEGPMCGEPQRAEILRDDSPWDAECFRLKKSGFVEPLAGK